MNKRITISPRPAIKPPTDQFVESGDSPTPDIPAQKQKRLTIDIDQDLHTKLKVHCAMHGVHVADFVRELIGNSLVESEI